MRQFSKICDNLDASSAIAEIAANDHWFGELTQRADAQSSPHREMQDIWVRYADVSEMLITGDFSKISEEHDSVWLKDMPAVKSLCFEVMALVDGERLGGVLVTKLPPGGKIRPHRDTAGWHAEYYDKYYIPIQNKPGSIFCFEDGVIEPNMGELWQFDNNRIHWVENNTDEDRIAMIVCVKQDKYNRGGELAA